MSHQDNTASTSCSAYLEWVHDLYRSSEGFLHEGVPGLGGSWPSSRWQK